MKRMLPLLLLAACSRDIPQDKLLDILNQELLISMHGYRQDEFLAIIRLAEEFGFHVQTIQHGVEAYKIAPELAASGVAAAVWTKTRWPERMTATASSGLSQWIMAGRESRPPVQNALVSAPPQISPGGLWYSTGSPVAVSVTVIVYSTSVSAPQNTHRWPLTAVPSSALTTSSTLSGLKNQK